MKLSFANAYSPPVQLLNNHKKTNNLKVVSFTGKELITTERQNIMGEIQQEIEKAKKIAVFTPVKPDGDAAGSAASLKNLIKTKYPEKQVDVFIADDIPTGFKVLNDTSSFEYINRKTDLEKIKQRNYDLSISVDVASTSLMGNEAAEIFNAAPKKIKIDHHSSSEKFGDIELTCSEASSASQVILMLADSMKVKLNQDLAADIYLGLVTDTGGFRYMTKPADVFEDCSTLTKTGFDTRKVYCSAMDYMSQASFKLYSDIIKNIKFSEGGKLAYIVDDNTLNKQGISKSDVKNIFDTIVGEIMPNIEGVKIAAKINDQKNQTSGSLRGNGVSVDKLAEKFGGGGHEYASGFARCNQSVSQILQQISDYLKTK
ncbi:MAG: bifunctional oligoribonuclease/PAP phosphatase NrnA [Candidatus Gastranaerophilaceae bacterium]|jgi:phosphoesterase RecJ-like protein